MSRRGGTLPAERRPRSAARPDLGLEAAALLAPPVVLALGRTLHFEITGVENIREARESSPDARVIYCCWHESLLPLLFLARGRGMRVLVSRHRDGEIAARVARRLGFQTIRGSTRRGGARALLEALRERDPADLALTPDGPRGPRRSFQQGAVLLASLSGLPVVGVGCAASRAWRLASWDRFQVPKPFSTVHVVVAPPLFVPDTIDATEREAFRVRAESTLAAATSAAEEVAR